MADKELDKKKAANPSNVVATEAPPIDFFEPDEWYVLKFMEAEAKEGKFGPYFVFSFKVLTGETESGKPAKGLKVKRMMDATLCKGRPLWDFATVMLGREPKLKEKLNLTAFYGEKYRGLIRDQKKKKGDTSNKRYQQVESIKVPKAKAATEEKSEE